MKENETIEINLNGFIQWISKEEFEELLKGDRTFKEMFD